MPAGGVLRRRSGFYKVLHAKIEAGIAGAPIDKIIEIEDEWVAGRITWREAVRRLEELARRYKASRQEGRQP